MIKDLLRFIAIIIGVPLLAWGVIWWTGWLKAERTGPSGSATADTARAWTPARFEPKTTGTPAQVSITPQAPAPAPKPVEPQPRHGVAATVNGETISREEVDFGINPDLIGATLEDVRQTRLDRLIDMLAVRQYLTKQGVTVPDADVERTIADLRKNPPASGGCPCCSYNSLDGFLAANCMTLNDLSNNVRNNLSMAKHVDALWNADYPPGLVRRKFTAGERPRIERTYARMSHIFFKTAQQPDFEEFPDAVRAKARDKATDAWHRLQKGEDFAKLAGKTSEDFTTRAKGGNLGCIPKDTFGRDVQDACEATKPGECTPPVESPWGYHVIRCERLTDEEIVEILHTEYRNRKEAEISASIKSNAVVKRSDE